MVTEFLNISLFSLLGIILMLLGSFCIDLVIPCSFPEEIKKGNKAIGWISAGAYISIGIIIRTAIASSDSGFFIKHYVLLCNRSSISHDRISYP